MMRKWRVGTVSMGISLILLGVFLFLSQIQGYEAIQPFLAWWPLVLIVLGAEIIAYIILSKQESPLIKYDIFSIMFVGVLGTVGIVLTLLLSTGMLQEFQQAVGSEDRTFDLPVYEHQLSGEIKRVVVDAGSQNIVVEGSNSRALHLFGTYTATILENEAGPIRTQEDYMMTELVGDTLHIYIKEPAMQTGLFNRYTRLAPTVAVPEDVAFELRGKHQNVELYPNHLTNHWTINHQGDVQVTLQSDSDIRLTAESSANVAQWAVPWEAMTESVPEANKELEEEFANELEAEDPPVHKASLDTGSGQYRLNVLNSSWMTVRLIEFEA